MSAVKRLVTEYRGLLTQPVPFGRIEPTDNPLQWKAYLNGPEGSPYEGGVFEIDLTFPAEYPMRVPDMEFKTKIFHANISTDGTVCSTLLTGWAPTDTVVTILQTLFILLAKPNRKSPYQGSSLTDNEYNAEARSSTQKYAKK
ncbi:ubiquitin conjugating enzyme E2 B-like [Oppia nitens]|uniref:ubiquitin conjugating enzyme E2 B-like n=1 Tax=Oppia nitens TaxID=1686743 RepID=UPI0023DB6759|nr:ubiquitin conjugating enzyme E2 B-like [Oppia nitens]